MQSRRLFLVILSFVTLFFLTDCLTSTANEASSVPYAIEPDDVADGELRELPAQHAYESDDARLTKMREVLNMIEAGRRALRLIEEYDIDVVFDSGSGTRFKPNTNQIIIDRKCGHFSASLILIHEVTHARLFHDSSMVDVHLDSREVYAEKKVEEEMLAEASRIEASMELAELGVDISSLRSSLYYTYRQAYGTAYRKVKWNAPGTDVTEWLAAGHGAGRDAVLEALMNGDVVTSNTGQSYMDYWRLDWDKQNGALI